MQHCFRFFTLQLHKQQWHLFPPRIQTKQVDSTLLAALRACSCTKDLELGQKLGHHAARTGLHTKPFYASSLINMFSRIGCMRDAQTVFDKMDCPDVVTWNSLILGYARNGKESTALELFAQMSTAGCTPDSGSYVAALKACSSLADGNNPAVKSEALNTGVSIHSQVTDSGCDTNLFVANTLVDMYGKCGKVTEAQKVFDKMDSWTVVSWNALILGYAENGDMKTALRVFERMQTEGCEPNARTYVAVLKACSSLAAREQGREINGKLLKVESLEKGRDIHLRALRNGFELQTHVANTLLDMYSKCGSMVNARRVFHRMLAEKDVVSWTTLILGYAENGEEDLALSLFREIDSSLPNGLTYVAALKACSSLAGKEEGRYVEGKLVELESLATGMEVHSRVGSYQYTDVYVGNTLIDMYCKCGSLLDARTVFDRMEHHTVVTWNCMILGYSEQGEAETGYGLFTAMRAAPDARTFVAVLKACVGLAAEKDGKELALQRGRDVHARAEELGFQTEIFVATGLIEMYASCGCMSEARRVFDVVLSPDTVLWTSLMIGYVENGEFEPALESFVRFRLQGHLPDVQMFLAALKACGSVVALETLRAIHADTCRTGLESYGSLANSLVDVYGKCGSLTGAQQVFDSVPNRDSVTWTALLAGYSREGDNQRVFELFDRMVEEGVQPDGVTFVCVLAACSHSGLVEKGKELFLAMSRRFGWRAGVEHYVCMMDLLCRANEVETAVKMVKTMPFQPNVMAWKTILGGCGKWNDVKAGKLAFDSLVELGGQQGMAYVLLQNIYRSN